MMKPTPRQGAPSKLVDLTDMASVNDDETYGQIENLNPGVNQVISGAP